MGSHSLFVLRCFSPAGGAGLRSAFATLRPPCVPHRRNSSESGAFGGAQSFGVTESAAVSPEVCAPGKIQSHQLNQKESSPSYQRQNRGHKHTPADDIRSRVSCPDGVGFAARYASGGWSAVLVAKLTRAVSDGVSVRVIGCRLGLQPSKPDDKHGNVNGRFCPAWDTKAVSKSSSQILYMAFGYYLPIFKQISHFG